MIRITSPKIGEIDKISFHAFWSKLNSYPSFCRFYWWKINVRAFLVFNFSSFSSFHDFQLANIQEELWISKIQKWAPKVSEISKSENIICFNDLPKFSCIRWRVLAIISRSTVPNFDKILEVPEIIQKVVESIRNR